MPAPKKYTMPYHASKAASSPKKENETTHLDIFAGSYIVTDAARLFPRNGEPTAKTDR